MESRMTELMEAIQESEGQAERRVLTLLGGRCISEKALVIDGKIVWESRKNGYFHGYTDEIKNITESGITYIGNEKVFCDTLGQEKQIVICGAGHVSIPVIKMAVMMDCEVIVLEDRPMYADHARMAGKCVFEWPGRHRLSANHSKKHWTRYREVRIRIL